MIWGRHLIMDIRSCCGLAIRNRNNIIAFSKKLVSDIDMQPFGEPLCEHFGSGNKAGYTLVQLIHTSNIVAHFVEETDDMYLDVFSCKDFSEEDVKKCVIKHFHPISMNIRMLERAALK
jgi:S-adenosylmethionine/arginine decarboxylase-like enzyme